MTRSPRVSAPGDWSDRNQWKWVRNQKLFYTNNIVHWNCGISLKLVCSLYWPDVLVTFKFPSVNKSSENSAVMNWIDCEEISGFLYFSTICPSDFPCETNILCARLFYLCGGQVQNMLLTSSSIIYFRLHKLNELPCFKPQSRITTFNVEYRVDDWAWKSLLAVFRCYQANCPANLREKAQILR